MKSFRIIGAALKSSFLFISNYFDWILKCYKNPKAMSVKTKTDKITNFLKPISKRLKIEIHAEGFENLPYAGACYFCNHISVYDPLIIIETLNGIPISFVAKKESIKIPFAGKIIGAIDGQYMDRNDLKQSLKVMKIVENDLSSSIRNWLIFPEGTRLKDPRKVTKSFHAGTFKSAMRAKAPLIPIAIFGSHNVLNMSCHYDKYPVFIKALKPITYDEYKDMTSIEISEMIQKMISKEVTYNLKIKYHQFHIENRSKNYKFNSVK